MDAYKIWGIRESNLVTKSLRKISVHKIAIINASHYGMARVSREGNKTYKTDFLGVKTGHQPHIPHQYRRSSRSREIRPIQPNFGLFERKLAKNGSKSSKIGQKRLETLTRSIKTAESNLARAHTRTRAQNRPIMAKNALQKPSEATWRWHLLRNNIA